MRLALAPPAVLVLAACAGTLPEPTAVDDTHRGEQPQVVISMPPPGKVEIVPPPPTTLKHPVWIDGEWDWTGRRWVWKEHGWEDAPADQVWEPPITKRLPDGKLVHFAGRWKKIEASPP